MTLIEKFYEWWERADFEDILMTLTMFALCSLLVIFLTLMLVALTLGGMQ